MGQETPRLTAEQRLVAIERENVVLRDKLKMLHGMLKQQRQVMNEYITEKILLAEGGGPTLPYEDSSETMGHFLCRQRFEQMEERLEQLGTFQGQGSARRQAV